MKMISSMESGWIGTWWKAAFKSIFKKTMLALQAPLLVVSSLSSYLGVRSHRHSVVLISQNNNFAANWINRILIIIKMNASTKIKTGGNSLTFSLMLWDISWTFFAIFFNARAAFETLNDKWQILVLNSWIVKGSRCMVPISYQVLHFWFFQTFLEWLLCVQQRHHKNIQSMSFWKCPSLNIYVLL